MDWRVGVPVRLAQKEPAHVLHAVELLFEHVEARSCPLEHITPRKRGHLRVLCNTLLESGVVANAKLRYSLRLPDIPGGQVMGTCGIYPRAVRV